MLTPCGDEAVARHLAPLMLCTVRRGDEELTTEQRGAILVAELEQYRRLLHDLPEDLLLHACDEHARQSKYFPMPAELREFAEAEFRTRHDWSRRIGQLEAEARKPARAKMFQPEPEEVRWRSAVACYERHRNSFLGPTLRPRAVEAEHRLAEVEGRPIADWALEQATQPTPPPISRPPRPEPPPTTIEGTAIVCKADGTADLWRAGDPLYIRAPEEPPLPDEIPEAVELEP